MNMKNMLKLAMVVVAFASMCCDQEDIVNVGSTNKRKWSRSEVNKGLSLGVLCSAKSVWQ